MNYDLGPRRRSLLQTSPTDIRLTGFDHTAGFQMSFTIRKLTLLGENNVSQFL